MLLGKLALGKVERIMERRNWPVWGRRLASLLYPGWGWGVGDSFSLTLRWLSGWIAEYWGLSFPPQTAYNWSPFHSLASETLGELPGFWGRDFDLKTPFNPKPYRTARFAQPAANLTLLLFFNWTVNEIKPFQRKPRELFWARPKLMCFFFPPKTNKPELRQNNEIFYNLNLNNDFIQFEHLSWRNINYGAIGRYLCLDSLPSESCYLLFGKFWN